MEGYVKYHRKIYHNKIIWDRRNHKAFILFHFCILRANRKEVEIVLGGQKIILNPGEFITSIAKMSEKTGLTTREVRTANNCLNKAKMLTSKTTNKFTVIKVNNFDYYQNSDKQNDKVTDKQTTNKRQANDNRQELNRIKYKKEKNIKKENSKFKIYDFLDEVQKKHFESKPEFLKYKLTSPIREDRILASYYVMTGMKFETEFEMIGQLMQDKDKNNKKLSTVLSIEDDRIFKLMKQMRENGGLSLKRMSEIIGEKATKEE